MKPISLMLAAFLVTACGGDDSGGSDDDGDGSPHSDAAAGDDDAAPGDDDAGTSVACTDYCETIQASCTLALKQYFDVDECVASCLTFPAGEPGADTGDSLACRAYHAELAVTEPDPHCRHAGPSGGDTCGSSCDGYCDLVLVACPDMFADDGECMTTCAEYPDDVPYSIRAIRTDSVACRIAHATRATLNDGHCGTASPGSTTCVEQ